jgi:hypothetical protein
MKQSYYKKGDWNAICALCGTKYKASELRWNSQIQDWVCIWDLEARHPQERLRGVKENQSVDWTRPDPDATFTNEPYIEISQTNPVNPLYATFDYSLP